MSNQKRLVSLAAAAALVFALSACASSRYSPVNSYGKANAGGTKVCYGGVGSRLPPKKDPHKLCEDKGRTGGPVVSF